MTDYDYQKLISFIITNNNNSKDITATCPIFLSDEIKDLH